MKKQVIATFLALMLTVPLMSGCGKQSEQPDSAIESTAAETSAAADTTDSAQEDETFTYDGTFNEEALELAQATLVGGKRISGRINVLNLEKNLLIY